MANRVEFPRRVHPYSLFAAHYSLGYACRPNLSAAIQVRQWSCGIGMWVEPRNLKASFTALAKHGTPPTLGLSPTPLAPMGWCGDGVVVQSVSHFGVSTAVGRK